jgi:hypothetical protein
MYLVLRFCYINNTNLNELHELVNKVRIMFSLFFAHIRRIIQMVLINKAIRAIRPGSSYLFYS